jgi:hypothetical protein
MAKYRSDTLRKLNINQDGEVYRLLAIAKIAKEGDFTLNDIIGFKEVNEKHQYKRIFTIHPARARKHSLREDVFA